MLSLLIMPAEEIRLGNVPGFYDTAWRDFIVIIPVKNLVLKEHIKIGNVEFYNEFNTIDDKIIGKTNLGKNTPDWNNNRVRAKVITNASEFRMALFDGYSKISTAIDLIALRIDMSFPRLNVNGENKDFDFHYINFAAQVTIPTWVYCRENDTDYWAIFNIEFPKDNILNLEDSEFKYFDVINQLFSKVLNEDCITQNEKKMLMVLHWLRRAIQSGDNKDKLLDLWTAMEFLMSGTKVTPLFRGDQKEAMKRLLCSNLKLTIEQEEVLFKKIDDLNNPPLMAKIDTLKKELEIDLTEGELELLDIARKKRNYIIHGKKDVDVSDKELNKLRSIIELLLIGKVSNSILLDSS